MYHCGFESKHLMDKTFKPVFLTEKALINIIVKTEALRFTEKLNKQYYNDYRRHFIV